jgi:hypothetical protein
VTGGYVYRGSAIPVLPGTYFFADFCSNQIYSFRYHGATLTEYQNRTTQLAPGGGLSIASISSFAEDGVGELYIIERSATAGEVFKIVKHPLSGASVLPPAHKGLLQLGAAMPNPFGDETRFDVRLEASAPLLVTVHDAAGRLVRTLWDDDASAGAHRISWDGRDAASHVAPSGVYFLRAQSLAEQATQRITRLR